MAVSFYKTETTLAADGASDTHVHNGGVVSVSLQGDFGGGTVTLQGRLESDGTWGTVTDILTGNTLSIAGSDNVLYTGEYNVGPCQLRVNLAGAADPDLRVQIAHTDGDRMTG